MTNFFFEVVLSCGFLINSMPTQEQDFVYMSFNEEQHVLSSQNIREDLFNSCIDLGLKAIMKDSLDPQLILVSAFFESGFVKDIVGEASRSISKEGKVSIKPLLDKRGDFLYQGRLQTTLIYTCPDLVGVPHRTWKRNHRVQEHHYCDPDLSGILYFNRLKRKHKKNATAVYCEYKKGHPCTDAEMSLDKSPYLKNRVNKLRWLKQRVASYKSNKKPLPKEVSDLISTFTFKPLTASYVYIGGMELKIPWL